MTTPDKAETGPETDTQTLLAIPIRRGFPHRFQPGVSGNPAGRPKKGHTLADRLRAAPARTQRQIAESTFREAKAGSARHTELILKVELAAEEREAAKAAAAQALDSPAARLLQEIGRQIALAREAAEVVDAEYRELPDAVDDPGQTA